MSLNIEYLKSENKEVVLFGSGKVGEIIAKLCNENNIKVACFCDNSEFKINTERYGLKIYPLSEIKNKFKSPIFIISLQNMNIDIFNQLQNENFNEIYQAGDFFEIIDYTSLTMAESIFIERCLTSKNHDTDNNFLHANQMDLYITEKCTLNCTHCMNFMPYYENPQQYDTAKLFKEVDILTRIFDKIISLSLIGGEPFMNKNIYDILDYVSKKDNIKFVQIFTNGTILPDENKINILKSKKIIVKISDYGNLSTKKDEICKLFEKYGILYEIHHLEQWYDYTAIKFENRTHDELKQLYKKCINTLSCVPYIDGKLFTCSYVAAAHNLKFLPADDIDYVDLTDNSMDFSTLKNNVKNFLYKLDYINACKYCNGKAYNQIRVPIAKQAKGKLEYKKYNE